MGARLSPRLMAIGELIPHSARLVDVGTDHGYLPVWAVKNRSCSAVLATDINSKPLKRAMRYARAAGAESAIGFRLCDGLDGISPGECDTVVIAGMGGENIAGILRRTPWAGDGNHLLILQPMTRDEILTRWLIENGFGITGGRLVREGGRIRQIITAAGGAGPGVLPGQLYAGSWLLTGNDPLLGEYLCELCAKLGRVAGALEKSSKESDRARHDKLVAAITELKKMKNGEASY